MSKIPIPTPTAFLSLKALPSIKMSWLRRINKRNVALIFLLAFQGGAINIVGFLFTSKFVTHITGFATMFGYQLMLSEILTALAIFLVPLFFLFGSFIAGWLIDRPFLIHQPPQVRLHLSLMTGLLIIAGFLVKYVPDAHQYGTHSFWSFSVANLLAFVSGAQNGFSSSLFTEHMRTSHLSGPTTDLGVGLARLFFPVRNRMLFEDFISCALRAGTILWFIVGSIVAAFIYLEMEPVASLSIPIGITGFLLAFSLNKKSHLEKISERLRVIK